MRATPGPLLLLLFACAAPEPGEPPPAFPPDGIRVVLELQEEPELEVKIELTLRGDAGGETTLELPQDWGGVGPDRPDLVAGRIRSADGGRVAVSSRGRHAWRVEHAPNAELTATILVTETSLRGDWTERNHYRPMLEPTLFHGIAHLLLPLPDELDWDRERPIEIAFRGFEEAGWDVVCSFGAGAETKNVRATAGELRGALFVAGELDVHRREIDGRPLYVSLDDTAWEFEGAEFADLVARVVEVERDLMRDPDVPFYWVNAIAIGPPQTCGLSFGGTGLSRCFALFLQPNATLDLDGPGGLPIRRLLAHECFHDWNGVRIRLAEPETECYWFSEGFTDHFARRVLREAGWMDDAAYAGSLNELLRDYYTSPARNRDAADLGAAFWSDGAAQRQPYLRGDVVAAIVDHAIRSTSDGERDLSHLMRELLAESEATGRRYGVDDLLARIEAAAGAEAAAAVRSIVVDGATAELPPDVFGPGFTLGQRKVYAFDAGFDTEASLAAKKVVGVRAGSAAADAGLADGMKLVGWSIYHGDTDHELKLQIEGEDGVRDVAYLPRGAATTIPEVRVAR